jgi:Cysteine rich repeat
MVKTFFVLGSRGRAQGEGNMFGRILLAGLAASCLLVPTKAQAQGLQDIRTYCVSDIKRLCAGIEPGGGRLIKCLKAHKKEMSVGCALALKNLKAKRQ